MAKLLFVNDLGQTESNFIGAGSTVTDLNYLHSDLNKCTQVEITEDQYVGLLNGQKVVNFEESDVRVLDNPEDLANSGSGENLTQEQVLSGEISNIPQVDKETFVRDLNIFKKDITQKINDKPNHSQIAKAQDSLDYVNSIDVDSLSFPHDDLVVKMFKANKYINIKFF